ncbi:SCO family protein [Rhizosaccharibacter radicis]|uniref:SCO family protein n=1 Tax=Rhizosaccharibacter radicis TaxID=2782605 RepID=A0ABT1VY99_9PROT|nr:SCO family protein [Acetobacteraceae bacterium KSS12]
MARIIRILRGRGRRWRSGLATAVLLSLLAVGQGARAGGPDVADLSFEQHPGARLPLDAVVTDQTGRRQTFGDAIDGRPAVLALGYYRCPSLCGTVRDDVFAALSMTRLHAPEDYRVLFLSIDPRETAADALEAERADAVRWPPVGGDDRKFLVAAQPAIDRIAAAVGYRSRFDPALKQFLHPAGVVVVTGSGTVSSYLLGVGFQPGALEAALRRAAAGGIGARASPVLLLCFHFDPSTGRYSLAILKLLRIAGAVTVATMLTLVLLLHLRRTRA